MMKLLNFEVFSCSKAILEPLNQLLSPEVINLFCSLFTDFMQKSVRIIAAPLFLGLLFSVVSIFYSYSGMNLEFLLGQPMVSFAFICFHCIVLFFYIEFMASATMVTVVIKFQLFLFYFTIFWEQCAVG